MLSNFKHYTYMRLKMQLIFITQDISLQNSRAIIDNQYSELNN
jgi:hypothetical protein